jgi:hypothetical protein
MARDRNDDSDLTGPTDKITMILLHVGEARKGISRLENDIDGVKENLSTLQGDAVQKGECTQRHVVVAKSIESLSIDLKEIRDNVRDIKRTSSSLYPIVKAPHGDTSATAITQTLSTEAIENVLEKRQEKARKSITFWLSAAGAGLSLLSGLVFGLIRFSQYLERVNKAVEDSGRRVEETQREVHRVANQGARIVYVTVGADAGIGIPTGPTKVGGGLSGPGKASAHRVGKRAAPPKAP